MKSRTLLSSVACSLALASHGSLAQTTPSSSDAGPSKDGIAGAPFVVPRSRVHLFSSKIVDQVYELRVSVPEDYGNDGGLRPVIYALDGQWNFNLISDIVGKLSYDGLIPDPIVVAITWAGAGDQPAVQRARDFSPVPIPGEPGTGGAPNFLKVLENEVFPFVESTYRASRERVITGGSLGGLFVGYALLERPDLFRGYVASSGAFGLGGAYFSRRLKELPPDLLRDEHAYFTVGALYDNEQGVKDFVASLRAVTGEAPAIALDVIPGVGHTGNEPFAYTRGLVHAFQRPRLPLSQHFLRRYEGAYIDPNSPELPGLIIQASGGKLHVIEAGQRWPFVFYAETPERFYVEGFDVDLSFYRNDTGDLSFTLSYQRDIYEQRRH
jgi:predicted alpha/beta superfamily hydrolase